MTLLIKQKLFNQYSFLPFLLDCYSCSVHWEVLSRSLTLHLQDSMLKMYYLKKIYIVATKNACQSIVINNQ